MPSYLAHVSRERVRFRNPIFGNQDKKRRAIEILKKMEGIAAIKPGANSLLIFLEPRGDLVAISAKLEEEFPELAAAEPAGAKESAKPGRMSNPNAKRELELKPLLASGAATVVFALFGLHHLHALAGGAFSLLAARHVWQRRARL